MQKNNRFATEEEQGRFVDFSDWLGDRGRSKSTQRSYRSDWQDLSIWYRRAIGDRFDSARMDSDVIEGWRSHAEARGRSPSTVARRLAFARSYGAWLARSGVLTAERVAAVREAARSKRLDGGPRVLTDAELHRLLEHVDRRACYRDQAIFYVLIDTGLKVGELVALRVGDVDFSSGELHLQRRRRTVSLPTRAARKLAWSLGERGLLSLPESGEIVLPATGAWPPGGRVEPPPVSAIPALAITPPSPMPLGVSGVPMTWPLFVGERGGLTANAVQRVVRKHATFARVDASPQVLRHTFALAHWARTEDLVGLAEVLGHESVESARIYTRIVPEDEPKPITLRALA